MSAFINFSLLSPVNALIVVMVLIFVAMGAFAIYSNAGALTPRI